MPGMKEYIDGVVAKRLERSIKKSQKEVNTYNQLKQIIQEHPNFKATINGIVKNNRKFDSLKTKLDKV